MIRAAESQPLPIAFTFLLSRLQSFKSKNHGAEIETSLQLGWEVFGRRRCELWFVLFKHKECMVFFKKMCDIHVRKGSYKIFL